MGPFGLISFVSREMLNFAVMKIGSLEGAAKAIIALQQRPVTFTAP